MTYTEPMLRDNAFLGKTIVITGGGTGLGKSMTKYFMQLGANTIITSRKIDVLQTTAQELEAETNAKCLAVACDVRHYEQVESLYQEATARFGKIDALVNNAAGNFISPTEKLSANAFKSIIDIVLMGTIHTTLAFGKAWIAAHQPATILNISTTYAYTGSGYVLPSACAKAGVLALTKSLAVEWAKYGIRQNAIAPGPFPSKGAWDRLLPGDLSQKFDLKQRNPLKRLGEHQELANLAAYLISDFSAYVNGDVITIDGGEWLKGAGQFNMLDAIPNELWEEIEKMIKTKK